MEKERLIKAINSKGLSNSLISIYYNIGRALPFRAQRFPDGRVSNWYASQFVEVHKVMPGGKGGKYGDAFGFYYRNNERANSSDDDTLCWCKKDDTEPQKIPNAGCGSWILLDILGEQTAEPTKIYGLDDVLEFGKHKGDNVRDVLKHDAQWVKWAINNSEHFFCDLDDIQKEYEKNVKIMKPEDLLPFGKYKGKTFKFVFENDFQYLLWLSDKSSDFIIDFEALKQG